MLKIIIAEGETNIEAEGNMVTILSELSLGISLLYNKICDQKESQGERFKTMLKMAVLDGDSPLFRRINTSGNKQNNIKKIEFRFPFGFGKRDE